MVYFDTSYLVRIYLDDPGFEEVRGMGTVSPVGCSIHGRMETIAAFHRKYRDQGLTQGELNRTLDQFSADVSADLYTWFPVSSEIVQRAEKAYRRATARHFLRAGDALHLATAAENGFREIYSNDRHLLAAATLFGLKGRNVIV